MLVKGELESVGQGHVTADLKPSELSCELGHTGSECRHCKTCDILVSPECDCYEGEEGACQASDEECCDYRKQNGDNGAGVAFTHGGLIEVGGNQSEDSAHVHDSLNAQVEVS